MVTLVRVFVKANRRFETISVSRKWTRYIKVLYNSGKVLLRKRAARFYKFQDSLHSKAKGKDWSYPYRHEQRSNVRVQVLVESVTAQGFQILIKPGDVSITYQVHVS